MRCVRDALTLLKGFLTAHEGFSLIEMAITLAIMGILAGLVVPGASRIQRNLRYGQSEKNIKKVLHAVALYAQCHGSLPEPCMVLEEGVIPAGRPVASGPDQPLVGYVPYRTLGLSRKAALDGWGHPLRYVCANGPRGPNHTSAPARFMEYPCGSIKVQDEKGRDVFTPPPSSGLSSTIAVVLIAFNDGNPPQGVWENQNYQTHDRCFIDAPYSTHPHKPFRHLVKWITNLDLINLYGLDRKLLKNSEDPPEAGPMGSSPALTYTPAKPTRARPRKIGPTS